MPDVPSLFRIASAVEVRANGGKIPSSLVTASSGSTGRTTYASTIPGVVLDCNIATGARIGGGTPTDNATAINTLLATATSTNPVHLVIDGGCAMRGCPVIPATGHVTISGLGWDTGFFLLPGSNSNGLQNFAATDLARDVAAHPPGSQGGQGSNVVLRDFRLHCNRGTYPNGNCNGTRDGTYAGHGSDSDTPSAKGPYPNTGYWLSGITFVGLDNLTIENVWCYDSPTYSLLLGHCTNVFVRGCRFECVNVSAQDNTDGIHLNGGCANVYIDDCTIITGDDALAFNFNEGDGTPGGDVVASNCRIDALAIGRVYGLNTASDNRVTFRGIKGTVHFWGVMIGEGNAQVDTGVETNRSILLEDIDVQVTTGDGPILPAIAIIAGNCGLVELNKVRVVSPIQAHPIVRVSAINASVSSLRMVDCGVHRDAAGSAAAYLLEASHNGSTLTDVTIEDCYVTEQYGQAYTDIASLVNVQATTVSGLSVSGRFRGVGTVVNTTGGLASIDAPSLFHKSNAGSATARTFVASGSTVPVSVGRFSSSNLAGLASGTVTLTGPGIMPSNLPVADALMGNGSPYLGSDHSNVPCVKVAGTAKTFNLT